MARHEACGAAAGVANKSPAADCAEAFQVPTSINRHAFKTEDPHFSAAALACCDSRYFLSSSCSSSSAWLRRLRACRSRSRSTPSLIRWIGWG